MNKRFVLISAACIAVQSCGGDATSLSPTESEVIADQLSEIFNIPYSGLSSDEMASNHLRFFAGEPTILPADQRAIVGREAVAGFYYSAYREIDFISNEYRDVVVDVRDDVALRRFIVTSVFRIAGQPGSVAASNRYLDILVKEDGEWRILLHSWVPVSWE